MFEPIRIRHPFLSTFVLVALVAVNGCQKSEDINAGTKNGYDAGQNPGDGNSAANNGYYGSADAVLKNHQETDADEDAGADDGGQPVREGSWRFIVTGDSRDTENGFNEEVLPRLVEAILNEHHAYAIDLVIFLGDMVYSTADIRSELLGWRDAMQPVYDAGIAVYAVRGNHELSCPVACWQEVFSGPYALPDNGPEGETGLTYSFSHRNAFFVGFDNYSGNKVNLRWVENELKTNTRAHVFPFAHEPAFAVYHSDCLDEYPEKRDRFWASLEQAGARVYLCGHDHFFDHARVNDKDGNSENDIHQYIVGTAGGPIYSFSPPYSGNNSGMSVEQIDHAETYGFVLVEVENLEVTLTWMPLDDGAGPSWRYTAST